MVQLEWGLKRTCLGCSARFYDLRKSPIVCPKCGTVFETQTSSRRRGRQTAVTAAVEEKIIPGIDDDFLNEAIDLPDDLDTDIAGDDALIEDDDLDGSLDDVTGIVEKEEEHEEI